MLTLSNIILSTCQCQFYATFTSIPGCIQQSSSSPQGQLSEPHTRGPAQSESWSQSPSPTSQKPAAMPLLQQSLLPLDCQVVSDLGLHGESKREQYMGLVND